MKEYLGTIGDKRVNVNGKNVLDVCLQWNPCVTNTMFAHIKIHMYTREEGSVKSMIDFVIVDERLRTKVRDTLLFRGVSLHTDHLLCRIGGLFKRWRHKVSKLTSVLERIKVATLQEDNLRRSLGKSRLIA